MGLTNRKFTSVRLKEIINGSCANCHSNDTDSFNESDDKVYFFCKSCFNVVSVSSNAHGDKGDAWLHIYKNGKEIASSEQFVNEFDYTLGDEDE